MATKGYSSYHGRVSPGKIALIVVLVLILLGAIAYLVVQNYLVYDESGQVHLELPFFQQKDNDGGTEPAHVSFFATQKGENAWTTRILTG